MAWTTPITFATGRVVTAADMNTYILNNLAAIKPTLINVATTINAIGSGHTGATQNIGTGAGTLALGDLVFLAGRGDGTLRQVQIWAEPIVTTANQVTIQCYNSDSAASGSGSVTLRFLKIPAAGV